MHHKALADAPKNLVRSVLLARRRSLDYLRQALVRHRYHHPLTGPALLGGGRLSEDSEMVAGDSGLAGSGIAVGDSASALLAANPEAPPLLSTPRLTVSARAPAIVIKMNEGEPAMQGHGPASLGGGGLSADSETVAGDSGLACSGIAVGDSASALLAASPEAPPLLSTPRLAVSARAQACSPSCCTSDRHQDERR